MVYFTGRDIHGSVSTDPATTFRDLVNTRMMVPVPINCTREHYHTLNKKERDEIKKSPYLVAAVFKRSPARRKLEESAGFCNLLFLDIDPDKATGKSPAVAWVREPDMLAQALHPFAFACYHTASSTAAVPRIRIAISADRIPVTAYPDALRTVARRIGLGEVTKESLVAVQAMYMPSVFEDQIPELEHPLFLHRMDEKETRPFGAQDIDGGAVKPFKQKDHKEHESDLIEFLRAPLAGITIEQCEEALGHVDPDCDYREWLDIAAALHHQFPDNDEAYELFDRWSSKGSKYPGTDGVEGTEYKWETFKSHPEGRLPKTIRTLFQRAATGGWNVQEVRQITFDGMLDWLAKVESSSQLMHDLPRMLISAGSLLNRTEEDAILDRAAKIAKTKFDDLVLKIPAMRADMKRLKLELDRMAESKSTVDEENWTKGIVYIARDNVFIRHKTGAVFSPAAVNALYSKELMPKDADKAANCRPDAFPTDYLLNVKNIQRVWAPIYDPTQPEELFPVIDNKRWLNSYRRCYPMPETDWENVFTAELIILEHLATLIKEEEYRLVMLDYMAYMVQNPGAKIRWSPLLQSADGGGKGLLAEIVRECIGTPHCKFLNGSTLFKGWTEWAANHMFIVLEEIRVNGQSRAEVMNILKPLVTNTTIGVDQRNKDTTEIKNHANYWLFTNHQDALYLAPTDRRFFVIFCRMQSESEILELGPSYFDPKYKFLKEHPGAFRAFLENHKVRDSFRPHSHPPKTPYFYAMQKYSQSDASSTIDRLIGESEHPLVKKDLISAKVLRDMMHQDGSRATPQQIGAVLREAGYIHIEGRPLVDGVRHPMWRHSSAHFPDVQDTASMRMKLLGDKYFEELL